MRILTRNGYIDSVALYFELTDEQLDRIRNENKYFNDHRFVQECLHSKGDNAHFYCLCNNGEQLNIRLYIKDLLKEYKTVSWWDKEMQEFKIIGRESCQ